MNQNLADFADELELVFDDAVAEGNEDELFAAGYLRGHFDLVVSQLLLNEETNPERLWEPLSASLEQSQDELNPQDRAHVLAMVETLKQRARSISDS